MFRDLEVYAQLIRYVATKAEQKVERNPLVLVPSSVHVFFASAPAELIIIIAQGKSHSL